MCGSGTLLIEGALMAADEAPGCCAGAAPRPAAGSASMARCGSSCWPKRNSVPTAGRAALKPVFFGADSDPDALRAAMANADRAGLGG